MATQAVAIGLDQLHYAVLTSDEVDGTPAYSAPVAIDGAISANINPNYSSETLFADDGPLEVASTLGSIELELNTAELSLAERAALLGHTFSAGVLIGASTDTPPWVAVGFRTIKSNGHYRYVWLAKGRFLPSEIKAETKTDKVNFQTPTIKGSFVKRASDNEWIRQVDEDDVGWSSSYATDWFTSPTAVG